MGEVVLDELLNAMLDADALGDGAMPDSVFDLSGGAATGEQIELSLVRLAEQPPDPDYVPDDWVAWLRWLRRAAAAGGCRSMPLA